MRTLFSLLFVVSLLALIVGLIKPGLLLPSFLKGRKKTALVLGGAVCLFLILSMLFTSHPTALKNKPGSGNTPTPVYHVFDVLSLVGKNIDEVRIVMGKPIDKDIEPTQSQLKQKIDKWQNTYEKEGRTLVVTFNPATRQVIDLFVSKNKGDTKEKLLKLYNLNEKDSRYKIQFVQASPNSSDFTGIQIMSQ